jgi:hypothetical protein
MRDETTNRAAHTPPGQLLAIAALVAAVSCAAPGCGDDTYEVPDREGTWVLVDNFHTRIQNPIDYRLEKENYNYQGVYGYHRVFQHLQDNGYNWSALRKHRINERRLEGYDVLFINLLHSQRPDFDADEIAVIDRFVRQGGGLFIIADHSNVYRHAERINPILEPMGIEVLFNTVIDRNAAHQVQGGAWIAVDDFSDHPINESVEMISLQTGGPFATEAGTAYTSEEGFADLWNEDKSGGYGDWKFNGDETVEPRGKLAVMAATTYGEGRVVVAGDQNMFGDAWTHFGDNFAQVTNIFEWTAFREGDPIALRDRRPVGLNIGLDIAHNDRLVGQSDYDGYYGFFANLNRDAEITARATPRIDPEDDVQWFVEPEEPLTEADLEATRQFLRDGKRVVLTLAPETIEAGTIQLVQDLAPDFDLVIDGRTISFTDTPQEIIDAIDGLTIPRYDGQAQVTSGDDRLHLREPGLDVAIIEERREEVTGEDGSTETETVREPFLYELTSSWGEPLLTATADGASWDIARRARVEQGELVIVVQGTIWRNHTLGRRPVEAPDELNIGAHDLQFAFLDYLKKPLNSE